MIGQYTRYSISYPSFHTYTYINKFCGDILFSFYTRKIQDTDDWTLVAVLLMGNLYNNFGKTRNMLFYTSTPLRTSRTKNYRISVCKKPEMWRGWDEKVTNRRNRAFIQKIVTPFSSSKSVGIKAALLLYTPAEIPTNVRGRRVTQNNPPPQKNERQYSQVECLSSRNAVMNDTSRSENARRHPCFCNIYHRHYRQNIEW